MFVSIYIYMCVSISLILLWSRKALNGNSWSLEILILQEKVTNDLPMPPLFQFLTILAFKIFTCEEVGWLFCNYSHTVYKFCETLIWN